MNIFGGFVIPIDRVTQEIRESMDSVVNEEQV